MPAWQCQQWAGKNGSIAGVACTANYVLAVLKLPTLWDSISHATSCRHLPTRRPASLSPQPSPDCGRQLVEEVLKVV
jgi:hypothetical protein